jgi:uncharacterized protein YegP (UPF0339 family)
MAKTKRRPKAKPFKGKDGKFRWGVKGANGERVFTSGESFARKGNAVRAMKRGLEIAREAEIVEDV